jgi:hypothetical protein
LIVVVVAIVVASVETIADSDEEEHSKDLSAPSLEEPKKKVGRI